MATPTYALRERRGHWLLGSLRAFRQDRLRFLCDTGRMAPIVRFRLAHRRCYLISEPDLIRDVLVTEHRHMSRDPLVRQILEKTLGRSLLTSDGEHWKRQRRMIAPALHLKRVQGYADTMVQHALAVAEGWQDGQEADLEKEMDELTLSIVTAALFRVDSRVHAETVAETLPALQAIATAQFDRSVQLPDWLPTPEQRRQRRLSGKLSRIVLDAIRARRASDADGDDLLTMMVHMTDAETGGRMTDEEIRAEVITLYLAGFDTTALTLSYVWYELARQPAIEARLHEELHRVLGGRPPRLDDLEQLAYTRMLFKEALRLYPAAYFMVRAVAAPIELGGHVIPRGSVLMISPFAMHRRPDLWKAPERFVPERFADDAERGWHKFKYFPFGGGPRICIGNQFALTEGPLILATVAQRYRFELLHPERPLEFEPQITLGPKGGMPMRFHRRRGGGAEAGNCGVPVRGRRAKADRSEVRGAGFEEDKADQQVLRVIRLKLACDRCSSCIASEMPRRFLPSPCSSRCRSPLAGDHAALAAAKIARKRAPTSRGLRSVATGLGFSAVLHQASPHTDWPCSSRSD